MGNDKYVGLDVHQASIVAAVLNAQGKCVMESVLETKGSTIVDFITGLSGRLHLTFEEGTQSAWLYDLINPLVAELVVCNPRKNKLLVGENKGDRVDAQKLAHRLRLGELKPADYRFVGGKVAKRVKPAPTRGLNRNHNHRLKQVFKGAAIEALKREPLKAYYQGLVRKGIKPELARLSVARKLASITLSVWKKGEEFKAEEVTKLAA